MSGADRRARWRNDMQPPDEARDMGRSGETWAERGRGHEKQAGEVTTSPPLSSSPLAPRVSPLTPARAGHLMIGPKARRLADSAAKSARVGRELFILAVA